jgi:hypothetical protein
MAGVLTQIVTNGDFLSIAVNGKYVVAAATDTSGGSRKGFMYSSNYGQSWATSTINPTTTQQINAYVNMYEKYVIAATTNYGVLYSINYGATFNKSSFPTDLSTSNFKPLVSNYRPQMYENYALVVLNATNNNKIYYSSDYGKNWIESIAASGDLLPPLTDYINVVLSGQYAIAGTSGINGIYYSSDYGYTWRISNITTIRAEALALSNSGIGIASSYFNGYGIYRTTDNGANWVRLTTTGTFSTIGFGLLYLYVNPSDSTKNVGVACPSNIAQSIWYSTGINVGLSWAKSSSLTDRIYTSTGANVIYGNPEVCVVGVSGIIYYSINKGQTWTAITENPATSLSVCAITGSKVIAGTNTVNGGLFYTTGGVLCYEKNVNISCLINETEQFIKICNLKKDMLVKTYKHGYKKITHIKGFTYFLHDSNDNLQCLYKMKNKDIILTGGHSLLVDTLTDEQQNNKYNFKEMIEDKHLLLSCLNENFEKITETKEYELFHLVLEHEDENHHYGIYINDYILSESCSRNAFEQRL